MTRRPRTGRRLSGVVRDYLPGLVCTGERRDHHDVRRRLGRGRRQPPERIILILGFANLVADLFHASNFLARRSYAKAEDRADRPEAMRHGAATLVGFLTAGIVPLVAYVVLLADDYRFPLAIVLTLSTLFAVGAARALVTRSAGSAAGSRCSASAPWPRPSRLDRRARVGADLNLQPITRRQ